MTSTTKAATSAPDTTKPASDEGKTDQVANTVVGSWTSDKAEMKDAVIDFNDDGSMRIHGTVPEKNWIIDIDGTYKMDGGKITMHSTSTSFEAPASADDATKKEVDSANKKAKDSLANQPDDMATIMWKDKDTFVMMGSNGTPVTFKRKA